MSSAVSTTVLKSKLDYGEVSICLAVRAPHKCQAPLFHTFSDAQPGWGAQALTYSREVGTRQGPGPGSGMWTRNAVAVQAKQNHGVDCFLTRGQV